jgi:hypothetical protein
MIWVLWDDFARCACLTLGERIEAAEHISISSFERSMPSTISGP